MYTYCTPDEWESEDFDLFYYEQENGKFQTREEAIHDAKRNGMTSIVVIHED
jgi:hypothetical protein